jgi:uncharacterized membrane protein
MATYSTAIRYVQGLNVASSGTNISFTVGDNQYYQVTAIGTSDASVTVTVKLSGIIIFSGLVTHENPCTILNGLVVAENTPVLITVSTGTATIFGNLLA